MAKEWVLNIATNRWQLNRPRYVGKVAEEIRKCQPRRLEDWVSFYKEKVKPPKFLEMKKHIQSLTIDSYLSWLGGKVFVIFSIKKDGRKEIYNPEVIEHIRNSIKELGGPA